ncbi:XkdQ/YqbQ family protein [Propionispora vibrioides]|nr:phage portal protein [Propionispora vibrioides]
MISYDVVLQGKHFLRETIEKLTLEDRLDEIACRATMDLAVPGDQFTGLPVIQPGHTMEIIGVPFGDTQIKQVFNAGPVWDVEIDNQRRRRWNITMYDNSIYMANSEDEYYFAEGTTATHRIKQIAAEWNIPIYNLPETGQPLAKAMHRPKNLWSIIWEALQETAEKSGKLYRLRMMPGTITTTPTYKFKPGGLELVELGSNDPVWVFELQSNLKHVTQRQTLDGAVTKVKIMGNASKGKRSPVVGTVTGQTELGTLQQVLSEHKTTDTATALKVANNMLAGVQETVSVTGIDINTIRAGDRVHLEGWPELLAISVKHDLGTPGSMSMRLATREHIRRRYYARRSL